MDIFIFDVSEVRHVMGRSSHGVPHSSLGRTRAGTQKVQAEAKHSGD